MSNVKNTLVDEKLLSGGDKLCVAVSGGVDSVVLLHILSTLADEFSLTLTVCHLNHNLRGRESEKDAAFVKELSKGYGLKFISKKLRKGELKGGSIQEQAREKRRDFYSTCLKSTGAKKIALAHNLDDQAETLLMRLLKGSSLEGLSAMTLESGDIIRPLLAAPRKEILKYAKKNKLKFREDSSNKSEKYLRNKLRLKLLPYLEKNYNTRTKETLARTASLLSLDNDFIEAESEKLFNKSILSSGKQEINLDRAVLRGAPPTLTGRVLIKALTKVLKEKGAKLRLVSSHVDSFTKGLKVKASGHRLSMPGEVTAIFEDKAIRLTLRAPKQKPFALKLNSKGVTLIPEANIKL
ncbi:MAG: tRNA lysidine(34) synthetase TilS, partial [Deltaproteobacteria bacterium]|nr:tRNA lysidine(34) synthetase TilS [Deltaproteobacteria bacterium]